MDLHGHIEFSLAAILLMAIPALAQIDTNNVGERAILATCGGLGAILALLGDKPKSWQDIVWRLVGGVIACFLFGPSVAKRFYDQPDMNAIIVTFGLTGVMSWYVLGSVTKMLISWRDSGGLGNAIKLWLSKWATAVPPAPEPPKTPDIWAQPGPEPWGGLGKR